MRIVSGRLGGRRLLAPAGEHTRPTSDRVREALFSILGPIGEASVLDLYAGTGALGIEALSRGATRCVFVESDTAALAALRQNLTTLGLDGESSVLAQRVERAHNTLLKQAGFDLVFVDPPYSDLAQAGLAISKLSEVGLLNPDAMVVLEHASKDEAPELPLAMWTQRSYGTTSLAIYTRQET